MDLSHKLPAKMDFTRYTVPVEITFANGQYVYFFTMRISTEYLLIFT